MFERFYDSPSLLFLRHFICWSFSEWIRKLRQPENQVDFSPQFRPTDGPLLPKLKRRRPDRQWEEGVRGLEEIKWKRGNTGIVANPPTLALRPGRRATTNTATGFRSLITHQRPHPLMGKQIKIVLWEQNSFLRLVTSTHKRSWGEFYRFDIRSFYYKN